MSTQHHEPQTLAILPAFNDGESVGAMVATLLDSGAQQAIVIDRGSADCTAAEARKAGAKVMIEAGASFGQAFFTALSSTGFHDQIILLCALDGTDNPREAQYLLQPIIDGRADMAVGAKGEVTHVHDRPWTNPLSALPELWLRRRMKLACGAFSSFIAIRRATLESLGVRSCHALHFEMQIKAALTNVACAEVPVEPGPGGKVGLSLKRRLASAVDVADLILTYDRLRPNGSHAAGPQRCRPQPRLDSWPEVPWAPWLSQRPRFRN